MELNLNSWDYDELGTELRDATFYQLLNIYKREEEKYSLKCLDYFDNYSNLNEDGEKKLRQECEHLYGSKIKASLAIAEALTKEK